MSGDGRGRRGVLFRFYGEPPCMLLRCFRTRDISDKILGVADRGDEIGIPFRYALRTRRTYSLCDYSLFGYKCRNMGR